MLGIVFIGQMEMNTSGLEMMRQWGMQWDNACFNQQILTNREPKR